MGLTECLFHSQSRRCSILRGFFTERCALPHHVLVTVVGGMSHTDLSTDKLHVIEVLVMRRIQLFCFHQMLLESKVL